MEVSNSAEAGPTTTRVTVPPASPAPEPATPTPEEAPKRKRTLAFFIGLVRDFLFPPLLHGEVKFSDIGPVEIFFWILLVAMMVNSALNDSSDPNANQTVLSVAVTIDFVLSLFFLCEFALRSWFAGERKLTADNTTRVSKVLRLLDLSVLVGNISLHGLYYFGIISLQAPLLILRCPRILRPLFVMTTLPNIRLFIVAITQALTNSKDVIVLYVFLLMWFGVSGVYQFGGLVRSRCVSDAFYSNATAAKAFISVNNLTINDFVCGSNFLSQYNLYSDQPHYDAFMDSYGVNNQTFTKTQSCSIGQTCLSRGSASVAGFQCPYAFRCAYVQNPYYGLAGFDDLGMAARSLFVCLTFQLWYEIMFWLIDSGEFLAYVFFLLFALVGGLMIANVTTVMLTVEYDKAKVRERTRLVNQLKGITAESHALQMVRSELTGALARIRGTTVDKLGGVVEPAETPGSPGGGGTAKNKKRRRGKKDKKNKRGGDDGDDGVEMTPSGVSEGESKDYTKWDGDWKAEIKRTDAQAAETAVPSGAAALLLEEEARADDENVEQAEQNENLEEEEKPVAADDTAIVRFRKFVYQRIVKTPIFTIVGTLIILMNFGVIAYDHYELDPDTRKIFDQMNLFFTIFFTVDMFVRFLGHHPIGYFKKGNNVLDVIIVVGAWVDYSNVTNISAIKALRVLRLVKLLKFFPSLYEWIQLIYGALKASPMLLFFEFITWFMFACFGVALLAGQLCNFTNVPAHLFNNPASNTFMNAKMALLANPPVLNVTNVSTVSPAFTNVTNGTQTALQAYCNGNPNENFDNFWNALLVAFQIMTGDNWDTVMYSAILARGPWITTIFVFYMFMSGFVLISLVVAILLSANQQSDDDFSGTEDLEAKIKRLEAQEEEEERKRREEERAAELAEIEAAKEVDVHSDESSVAESEDAPSERNVKPGGKKTVRLKSGKVKTKKKSFSDRAFDFLFMAWHWSERAAKKAVAHPVTAVVMGITIIVGSVSQGLENPIGAPDTKLAQNLFIIDIVVTCVYVLEVLANIHAYGLISKTTSYLRRDRWNVFDLVLVIISLVGIITDSLKSNAWIRGIKVLRALRPLRLVKRSPGMRLVLSSLINSSPQMANVAFLGAVSFVFFGVVGVQFFQGQFRQCYINSGWNTTLTNHDDCVNAQGDWINNSDVNFDSLPSALVALFVVVSLENWEPLMFQLVQNSFASAWYFIIFVLFVALFLVNFFVSVLVDAYNREKRRGSVRRSLFVTREQEAWILTNRRIAKNLPIDDQNIDDESDQLFDVVRRENYLLRKRVRHLVRTESFKRFMAIFIFVSFLSMAVQTYPSNTFLSRLDDVVYVVSTIFFVGEALLKIYGESWPLYIAVAWNRTDLFIAIASVVSLILSSAGLVDQRYFALIRAVRVIRLVRYIREYFAVDVLIRQMGRSILSLVSVMAFIFLIFYIFAVLGANLFGRVKQNPFGATTSFDHHSNFQRIDKGLILLLRITFGGNWGDLMSGAGIAPPFCDDDIGECGASSPIPELYFVVFLCISMFVLRNLFVAVMLDAFNTSGEERGVSKDHALQIYEQWKVYDEDGDLTIQPFDLLQFLRQIPARCPLGFNSKPRRQRVGLELQFLIGLKLRNTKDPVPLAVVIDSLCEKTYNAPRPQDGHFVDALTGSKSFIGQAILNKVQEQVKGLAKDSQQLTMKLLSATTEAAAGLTKKLQVGAAHLAGVQIEANDEGENVAELLKRKQDEKAAQAALLLKQQQEAEAERRRQEEEMRLFTEMASLIMINAIIRRRKELIKEQLMMQEKIAQRKFNSIGIVRARRALQQQTEAMKNGDGDSNLAVLSPMSALVRDRSSATLSAPLLRNDSMASPTTSRAALDSPRHAAVMSANAIAASPATSASRPRAVIMEEGGASLTMRDIAQHKSKAGQQSKHTTRRTNIVVKDVDDFFPAVEPDDAEIISRRIAALSRASVTLPRLTAPSTDGEDEPLGSFVPAALEFVNSTTDLDDVHVRVGDAAELREGLAAPPTALGRLVSAAAFVAAAASRAVEMTSDLSGETRIEAVLPVAFIPTEREKFDPQSVRVLLHSVQSEVAFMAQLLAKQRSDLASAHEVKLMREWYANHFPYDSIPADLSELRRWGQAHTTVLSSNPAPSSHGATLLPPAADRRAHFGTSPSRTPDPEEESASHSRPHSAAESLAGVEMDSLDLLHLPTEIDLHTSFYFSFFDRFEIVYGILGALEAMAPANLNAPFPLKTALPLVDDIIDHVGGIELDWDHVMQVYLDEGVSSTQPAGLTRHATVKNLKPSAAATTALTNPLPLQLNFESPYVVNLLVFVSEALKNGSAPAGDGTQTSTSKPSTTTVLKFKQQVAAHVERAKAARKAKRERWTAVNTPAAVRPNFLAGLASSSAATQVVVPASPLTLPTDEQFGPILRRCKNFRITVHKYLIAMRNAVMHVMVSLAEVMDSRRRSLNDNIGVLEAKTKYAETIADMLSLVDETASWMPVTLRVAADLSFEDGPLLLGSSAAVSQAQATAMAQANSKKLCEFLAGRIAAQLNVQPSLVARTKAACVAARLSAAAARVARVTISSIQRRAYADNAEFGTEPLLLLSDKFAVQSLQTFERIMVSSLEMINGALPTAASTSSRSVLGLSPISPQRQLSDDSSFGPRMISEYLADPTSDLNALRGVLSALQGSELRVRVRLLLEHGVCVSVVRRWVPSNPTGTAVPSDPYLVIQTEPGETCKHWIKLSPDLKAFEFWKPGSTRAPVTRLCLNEIASVDADIGPQAKIVTSEDAKEHGRVIRLTLGFFGANSLDDAAPSRMDDDVASVASSSVAPTRRQTMRLNSRFEFVAVDVPDDEVSSSGLLHVPGASGHASARDSFLVGALRGTGAATPPDGEHASRPAQLGSKSTATYGLRAVMSSSAYVLEPSETSRSTKVTKPQTVVFILPPALGYTEWLQLFRDVARFSAFLPLVVNGVALRADRPSKSGHQTTVQQSPTSVAKATPGQAPPRRRPDATFTPRSDVADLL